jgi:hypothetical protein
VRVREFNLRIMSNKDETKRREHGKVGRARAKEMVFIFSSRRDRVSIFEQAQLSRIAR